VASLGYRCNSDDGGRLTSATNQALNMSRHVQLKQVVISLMSSMAAMAVLMSGLLIWLDPQVITKDGISYLVFQINR